MVGVRISRRAVRCLAWLVVDGLLSGPLSTAPALRGEPIRKPRRGASASRPRPSSRVARRVIRGGARAAEKEASGARYTTRYEYNSGKQGSRTVFPGGHAIEQVYDIANENVLARGNLLTLRRVPAPGSTDPVLETRYTYKPPYQQVGTITDPRGNKTEFFYDATTHNLTRIELPAAAQTGGGTSPPPPGDAAPASPRPHDSRPDRQPRSAHPVDGPERQRNSLSVGRKWLSRQGNSRPRHAPRRRDHLYAGCPRPRHRHSRRPPRAPPRERHPVASAAPGSHRGPHHIPGPVAGDDEPP